MSSTYVLLPARTAATHAELEYLVSVDGRTVSRHASAQPALLPAPGGPGSELLVIAPAAMLSWHQVELPKGIGARSPKLRAVLEGLLEDRLLDEPEQLHFALGPDAAADGRSWVAVCERAWLRDWLQALESAGRPATRVVPEFAPEGTDSLHAVGEPEFPQLVCAGEHGVHVVPLAAASMALLPELPDTTPLFAEPAVAAHAEQVFQQAPALQPTVDRLLSTARSRWDLAQFEFARTGRARAFKRLSTAWRELWLEPRWRPARWGALALVVVQLVGLNAWAWKERSVLQAKREASRALLTQTFPQVRAVVDPPVQMEREVALLRQQAGGASARDLETMLGALAAAAPAGRTASSIEYAAGELRVRGVAGAPGEARALEQSLRGQGFAAALQGDVLVVRPEAQP